MIPNTNIYSKWINIDNTNIEMIGIVQWKQNGKSSISIPGSSNIIVEGDTVDIGHSVYVKNGLIISEVPTLPQIILDIS